MRSDEFDNESLGGWNWSDMPVTVQSFKMPFATKHFNQNQRVWVRSLTGAQAALCVGRFRGRGRYVEAWVNWGSNAKTNPKIQAFTVMADFAKRLEMAEFQPDTDQESK